MSYNYDRREKQERISKYILFGTLGAAAIGLYFLTQIAGCPAKPEEQEVPAKKLGIEKVIISENLMKKA